MENRFYTRIFGGYLDFLGSKYGNRISNIQLITNGSVLPDFRLVDTIRAHHVEVRLSDYSHILHYKERYEKFKHIMEDLGVKMIEFKQTEWNDFGFPHENVNMGETPEALREHMLACHGLCHWLHGGRYYYCSSAWSAQECGLYSLEKNQDYLELKDLVAESRGKERLLEFYLGNMKNGYMHFLQSM